MMLCIRICTVVLLFSFPAGAFLAADEVVEGSSRAEVLAAYGKPQSSMGVGAKEILTYSTGKVTLQDGKVVGVDLSVKPLVSDEKDQDRSAARPVSRSVEGTTASVSRESWFLDFDSAAAEAVRQHKRLLALFTGSDWCPACKHFESLAAHNPTFLREAQKNYVLIKLDYPRETPQSPEIRQKNDALLRRYDVDSFPTLMVISADTKSTARVDLAPAWEATDFAVGVTALISPGHVHMGNSRLKFFAFLAFGFGAVIWWLKR